MLTHARCLRKLNRPPATTLFFFLNNPPPTETSPLPLPAALPICGETASTPHPPASGGRLRRRRCAKRLLSFRFALSSTPLRPSPMHSDLTIAADALGRHYEFCEDRKSTRLNSSHSQISYAVFCLK